MIYFTRLKVLGMWKRKSFRVLLIIEGILFAAGIFGLFGKNVTYEYGAETMTCYFGSYSEQFGGILAESGSGQQGNMVDFTGIALPKGTYRVRLRYATDTDGKAICTVTNSQIGMKNLRTNGMVLFSGMNETNFEMWLLRASDENVVHVSYSGEGMLAVQGLTIQQTNAWNRILLFILICVCSAVNAVYCYVSYDREYHIPAKNKTVTFCLGLIILAASFPLTVDYMQGGGDLIYHLMRVEGIKDGLLSGQFPIRISPEWQQGYGYASPIFYGETILYLAAMFRLIGFTVTTSYRLFMLAVTAATVLIAYYCFKKMFRNAYVGVFCSMLYSLSVYRIYKTYNLNAFGEFFGIMLLPLLAYGFYRVFTQDIREKSYKRSWVPLTAGFSLVVQSHLLTGEIAGFFTVLLCILLWKKVFRRQTFAVLAKTVIYSLIFSAWFLVPFADYMLAGDFVIHHVSTRTIQFRGLFPAHLLFTFFSDGGTVFFHESGMYDSSPDGVGIVLVLALGVLAYLFWSGKSKSISREEKALGKIAAGFSVLSMLMSLSLFPWDRIQAINGFIATLVSSIQFPHRFLTVANVCLTVVAGIVAKYVSEQKNKVLFLGYWGGTVVLLILGSVHLTESMLITGSPSRVYNSEGMGTGYISGAEYLPYGADASRFVWHDPVCTGALEATDYEKLSLGARAHMNNRGDETESAAFGLLYYKGYQACDADTGQALQCYAGENFEVTVDIPSGYEGDIRVQFVSPWYWRAGELVTLIAVLVAAALFSVRKLGGLSGIDGGRLGEVEKLE